MAVKYTVDQHVVCHPGNLIASDYGRHTASVIIEEPTDNGYLCKVGTMEGHLDSYEMDEITSIDAYVALKGVDGLWLVVVNEVKDPRTALIYEKPLINYESPRDLTQEAAFYNDPKDGPVRAYLLDSLDRFWLSEDGFSGTPTVGAKITTITDGKPVIV